MSTKLPSCGFAVRGTKKGELPLKVEKRAKGKKVTIIPNVHGDAAKLARALMTMLGVGGTARHAEGGSWAVEVQGDQTVRVTQALLDFECLQGMTKDALQALKKDRDGQAAKGELVVDRNAATKFLAQTRQGAAMSHEEERRKALEEEAEFYGHFWQTLNDVTDDLMDVWDDSAAPESFTEEGGQVSISCLPLPQLNVSLAGLGMLAEPGRAVREFWDKSGVTLQQFRKMALSPGAYLIDSTGPGKKNKPTNLISRQKISDRRSGGGRTNYFSCTCSVIDDYQKGIVRNRATEETPIEKPPEPKMAVKTDENGWCIADLSYCVPFPVPTSRLDDDERSAVSKSALKAMESEVVQELDAVRQAVPGVDGRVDVSTFGLDLSIREEDFLHAPKVISSKKSEKQDQKEELKLEKKLRDICSLRRRQLEGETLDKLQAEKIAKKDDLFRDVAELKLRRAEKSLLKAFKKHTQRFQDKFWELEWKALYGDDSPAEVGSKQNSPFGIFDEATVEGAVTLSADGSRADSRGAQWAGVRLQLPVCKGEVGAFAIEVLEGLVRLGWAVPGAAIADLGSSCGSYGFGGTGKKVSGGAFEPYGQIFGPGDVIHCEAERDEGQLRIGFAKNNEPLGVAFDVADNVAGDAGIVGAVCGKGFKVRLVSAESMPLEEAPGLDNFIEYDPPRMAVVVHQYRPDDSEEGLPLWPGETVNVLSDDGEGSLFGFFLDPEDPEDGGWFPADCVQFIDIRQEDSHERYASQPPPPTVKLRAQIPPARSEPAEQTHVQTSSSQAVSPPSVVSSLISQGPPETSNEDTIEGLDAWLQQLSLQKYQEQALQWCSDMGAVSIEEIEEYWEDFADALSLRPLERKRLAKAVAK